MHSQSLLFLFKNEFGFDTLTVNGCFESSLEGFAKISKTFAIGSLNAMGLSLDIKIFTKPKVILLFLSKLRNLLNKMKSTSRNETLWRLETTLNEKTISIRVSALKNYCLIFYRRSRNWVETEDI